MDQRRSLVFATTMGLLALLLGSTVVEAQVPASIQPPVVEEAVDLDRNGLYDELRFHVTLDVEIAGTYQLAGSLWNYAANPSPVYVVGGTRGDFAQGRHVATVAFQGSVIYHMGNGPYRLLLEVYAVDGGRFTLLDTYMTEIGPYTSAAFEPPLVQVRLPFADEARDTDGNGLWDELVVRVGLAVRGSGTVRISGLIYLDVGRAYRLDLGRIFSEPVETQLEAGEAEVELVFPGHVFYAYGRDGPYHVSVRLAVEGVPSPVFPVPYETAAYRAIEFERTSVDFQGAPRPLLVDADGNGQADVLLLEVPLEVRRAGDYTLQGHFMDPCIPSCPWHSVGRNVHLEPGNRSVVLTVGGVNLQRAPGDGPWSIILSVMRRDGALYDFRAMDWSTPALNRSAFEFPQPVVLRGTVRTLDGRPVSMAHGTIYDPERKFHATAAAWGSELELTLYEGSFTFLFAASSPDPDGETLRGAFRVVLRNETMQDLVVTPASETLEAYNLTFRGWGEADAIAVRTAQSLAPWIRATADFYGDFDGLASEAELAFCSGCPFPPLVEVEVDGMPFSAGRTSHRILSGTGAYAQSAPLVTADTFVFQSESPLGESVPDSVSLRMPYDWEGQDLSMRVRLPEPDVTLFRSSPNVTLRRVDSTTWEIDPGRRPVSIDPGAEFEAVVEFRVSHALGPAERGLLVLAGVIPAAVVAYFMTRRSRRRRGELVRRER